jgi:hypothetical protein
VVQGNGIKAFTLPSVLVISGIISYMLLKYLKFCIYE